MSDYYSESFENNSNQSNAMHNIKLSIDLMSVRNMAVAANAFVSYQIDLTDAQNFQSQPPTAVPAGNQETKLNNGFAQYEFSASKSQLMDILKEKNFNIHLIHRSNNGANTELG
jgi:hypothetical protein